MRTVSRSIGLLVKISGIQNFNTQDRNFMKSNLSKPSYLDAFGTLVELGPEVVCRADVNDFVVDPRDDGDTDTLELPEWMFSKLKIQPGEPVSVTYDTSLPERQFFEFVSALEIQPLKKNFDQVVSANEVVELINAQEGGDVGHRTDQDNINSATEAVQLKIGEHAARHRVIETGQILAVHNGKRRFEFNVSRLYNQYGVEILSTLGLVAGAPKIVLDLDLLEGSSEDDEGTMQKTLTR